MRSLCTDPTQSLLAGEALQNNWIDHGNLV